MFIVELPILLSLFYHLPVPAFVGLETFSQGTSTVVHHLLVHYAIVDDSYRLLIAVLFFVCTTFPVLTDLLQLLRRDPTRSTNWLPVVNASRLFTYR